MLEGMQICLEIQILKFLEPHSLVCEIMRSMSGPMAASNIQRHLLKIAHPNVLSFP